MSYFIPYEFPFIDKTHEEFFVDAVREIGSAYPPTIAAIYLLSATSETRAHFWEMINMDGGIVDDMWDMWQDEDSRRAVALAVNLSCGDGYPVLSPAYLYASPLAPILRAAVEYWYCNRAA